MAERTAINNFSLADSMSGPQLTESPVLKAAQQSYEQLEKLKESVFIDSLTGAYNRSYLSNYVTRFDSTRTKNPIAIVFCDVDNLGAINKEKGDAAGDQLIIDVATNIKSSVRDEDIVIRKGGDEFVVIIEDFFDFEELKETLSDRFRSKHTPETKFSFGIVQYDPKQDISLNNTIQRGNDQMRRYFPHKRIPKH